MMAQEPQGRRHESWMCSAHSKASGKLCRRAKLTGREVCHMHGGKTPRGFASPHTKTGRWSKDMPTRLAARAEEARRDPELLVLRDDIALLDARLADVLERVDSGESGEKWRQLKQAWRAYEGASAVHRAEALEWVGACITVGCSDYAAWADVRTLLQERCRLVESERKRLVEMQQVITAEQAMMLLAVVTNTIRKHVLDRKTLAAIGEDLGRLVAARSSAEPGRLLSGARVG